MEPYRTQAVLNAIRATLVLHAHLDAVHEERLAGIRIPPLLLRKLDQALEQCVTHPALADQSMFL